MDERLLYENLTDGFGSGSTGHEPNFEGEELTPNVSGMEAAARRRKCRSAGHERSLTVARRSSLEDCLRSFGFGLPNDAGCRKQTMAMFSANGRSTLELDVRRPHGANASHAPAVIRAGNPAPLRRCRWNGCIRESQTGVPDPLLPVALEISRPWRISTYGHRTAVNTTGVSTASLRCGRFPA